MNDAIVQLKIFRFDPDTQSAPTYQTYRVPWREGFILLAAIKYVRDHLDETLAFRDYCCGCGWCTSCLMMVDGQGMRTCSRLLKPGESLVIEPMRGFPVIKDLVVDFGVTIATADGVFKKMEGTVLKKEKAL
jgi:succinate dehydrogenase/fumarate reductase-like Fe-S protein